MLFVYIFGLTLLHCRPRPASWSTSASFSAINTVPPFASLSISRRPLAPTAGADRTSPPPVAATAAAPYTCDDVLALVLVSLLLAVFEKLSRVL